jgi:hypothetical protein
MIKKLLEKIFGSKVICSHSNNVSKKVKYCVNCKLVINEN